MDVFRKTFFECRTTRPVAETMARSTSLALILSAILGIANAQVAVLDGDTFDATVVNGGKNAIVKFYAPWYDRTRGSGFPIDRRGPAPCRKRTSPRLSDDHRHKR